ncbi:MAG TPA: alcohol dehydrogenase catalytic domain-containing protein [Capsulimonadaceae bacterium]|jgi:threonine dehydrogenase-like Zn-dependent dehydrogenase
MDVIETYRAATGAVPHKYNRWHLRGAGLESLSEETVELPEIGPEELVVRHDTCGICFSDIKIINLGPQHPRLIGRDMVDDPVVMGHEVALTIVKVGEALEGKFKIGARYIVQADVYYKGANLAYGYVLDGGMSQYGVIGDEVLRGDEGCYLLPLKEDTGYVEAALVEPWACVVAAYEYPNFRDGIKPGGATLVYRKDASLGMLLAQDVTGKGGAAKVFETISSLDELDAKKALAGKGFDDIIVIGTPTPAEIETLSAALVRFGIFNIALSTPLTELVTIDIGRVHYDQLLYIGGYVTKASEAAKAYKGNGRGDLAGGGNVWFIGAGGPMGQMHIQRAIMHDTPPKTIIVTDVSDERLARVHDRFGAKAAERGIEIVALNPNSLGEEGYAAALKANGPFTDIVCLVPVADLVAQTAPHLAEHGTYNIFAGVAKGVSTKLDLGTIITKDQRFVGTSGSSIADLQHTLDLVEEDKLSTNSSLAAIGGRSAFRDGLGAVKAGQFPGKTVIFLQVDDLPLTSLDELQERLPSVYAKLEDGKFWTAEAEEELLRLKL